MEYAVIGLIAGAAVGIFITLGLVTGPTSQVPRSPAPRKQEDKFKTFLRPKTWGIR